MFGQECTISSFREVRIGEQCVIADRAMFIDFDHGVVEVERPIRQQGIYTKPVRVGANCWIGYNACFLRGVTVGDNSIVGTNSVVTKALPCELGRRRGAGAGASGCARSPRSCAGRTPWNRPTRS